ncbi:lipopolysaccharide biosynthesis protein [Polynucleobacter paneuropaeus]|nr:lipopolysaccharide biosynthesis protein [Polynucleobacter paneuropaeus]
MADIKKRIAVSFLANCFRGGSTLLVGVLLARFLGLEQFGRLVYLVATSMAIKQLLDLGSSSAFFTFLSQKTRSIDFIARFWFFFFGKYVLLVLGVLCVSPTAIFENIWPSESAYIVILAIATVSFQSDFWPIGSQMLESQRKTVRVQLIFMFSQITQFILIVMLHYLDLLTLSNYFIGNGLVWLCAGFVAISFYNPIRLKNGVSDNGGIKEYARYCLPIAPIIVINFLSEFFEKWLLQIYGGAKQQAFFSVSLQISTISLLIVASFIKIFWKEIAEAHHNQNYNKAELIYLEGRRILFYCAAIISCATFPWTREILVFMYGDRYGDGALVLFFLMLYAIHQSMGQIDSAFLMASGKTRIGLILNLLFSPIGFLLSTILIADQSVFRYGLGLGALGLAIKMVATQLISITILTTLIKKEFQVKIERIYEVKAILSLSIISVLVGYLFKLFIPEGKYIFVIGMTLYFLLSIIAAILFPWLFGLPNGWQHRLKLFFR